MKIIRLPFIDWEPLVLHLVHSGTASKIRARVRKIMRDFLAHRVKMGTCRCTLTSYSVGQSEIKDEVGIACEWMCEVCLDLLCGMISEELPQVLAVKIGDELGRIDEDETHEQIFVHVQPDSVLFEREIRVTEPYAISKHAIRVGQFARFAQATGHVTQAELEGADYTYLDNPIMLPFDESSRVLLCATCMCFRDAIAYCGWAGTRLPTLAEWLLACTNHAPKLKDIGTELVAASHESKNAMVVSGSHPQHRRQWGVLDHDLMLGFRVVKT